MRDADLAVDGQWGSAAGAETWLHPVHRAGVSLFAPCRVRVVQPVHHEDRRDHRHDPNAQQERTDFRGEGRVLCVALETHLVHAFDKSILTMFTQAIVSNQGLLDQITGTIQMVPHQAHVAQWRRGIVTSAALDLRNNVC